MGKRNVTIQVDESVFELARIAAARRNTSVSRLVAEQIHQIGERDAAQAAAWDKVRQIMNAAKPRGGRTWTRKDLNEERRGRSARTRRSS